MLMDFESLNVETFILNNTLDIMTWLLGNKNGSMINLKNVKTFFFHSIFFCWWGTTLKLTLELIGAKS